MVESITRELVDTQFTEPEISEPESESTSSESPSDLIALTPGHPRSPRVKLIIIENLPPVLSLIHIEENSDKEEEIKIHLCQEYLDLIFSEQIYPYIPFRPYPWYNKITNFLHNSS